MKIEVLKNLVYKTRKSRINASERLRKRETFIQAINVYYSCVLIFMSIHGLYNTTYIFSFLNIAASIALTMSLLFVSAQNYSERSQKLKENYINLQNLYLELENVDDSTPQIIEYQKRYTDLLNASENHSEYDYLKYMVENKEASVKQSIKYYGFMFLSFLIKTIIVIAPIVVFIYLKVSDLI